MLKLSSENKKLGRPKKEKVTWDDIYDDFKKNLPGLAKDRIRFKPVDAAQILVYLTADRQVVYDYDLHRVVKLINFC